MSAGYEIKADEAFTHFFVNMSCLVKMFRREVLEKGLRAGGEATELASMSGPGFVIRYYFRARGARPFYARMETPGEHSISLGRLDRDGQRHMHGHGVKILYDILKDYGLLDPFRTELERVLDRYLLGGVRPCQDDGGPASGPLAGPVA